MTTKNEYMQERTKDIYRIASEIQMYNNFLDQTLLPRLRKAQENEDYAELEKIQLEGTLIVNSTNEKKAEALAIVTILKAML